MLVSGLRQTYTNNSLAVSTVAAVKCRSSDTRTASHDVPLDTKHFLLVISFESLNFRDILDCKYIVQERKLSLFLFVAPVRKICFVVMQQRDSDSETLVQRHSRKCTEVLVVMMTSHYFLGKCCDIQWAI
jgi:hypothetical protein